MKKLIPIISFLFLIFNAFGQEKVEDTKYITPPMIQNDKVEIEITDIIANVDWCKMKISINNTTNGYIVADLSKLGFSYEKLGTYYPKAKEVIIPPNKKVTKIVKVKGNAGFNVDAFEFDLGGFSYAEIPAGSVIFETVTLEEGAEVQADDFSIEIGKVKTKKNATSGQLTVSFNGNSELLGLFTPQEIKILDGETTVNTSMLPKKDKILKANETHKLNLNMETTSASLVANWQSAFKVLTLEHFEIANVRISQTQESVIEKAKKIEKEECKEELKEERKELAKERAKNAGNVLNTLSNIKVSGYSSTTTAGPNGVNHKSNSFSSGNSGSSSSSKIKVTSSSSSTTTVNGRVIDSKSSYKSYELKKD